MDAPTSISAAASGGAAAKFLADLPSRGLFSSTTVPSSNPGGMRVYICDHNRTLPPEHQMIKTNQTNILIRSLMLKRSKGDSSSKDSKGTSPSEASRKRPADRAADGRALSKRPVTDAQVGSKEASKSRVPNKDIQNLTVERLRALLKEKGLSLKGRKDELIARLRGAGNQS